MTFLPSISSGSDNLTRTAGTITLEVFTPDRHYLAYGRDVLRRLGDQPR